MHFLSRLQAPVMSFLTGTMILLLSFFMCCSSDASMTGRIIEFGLYVQNDNNVRTPISFMVLDEFDNRLLLLSVKGIDAKPFNITDSNVTWENSSIRQWLNSDFLKTAFSDEELKYIVSTKIRNSPNRSYPSGDSVDTEDLVFLLSESEAESYFLFPEERIAIMTDYVKGRVFSDQGGEGDWWLRTSGGKQNRAAYVRDSGDIQSGGSIVNDDAISVRPAMWIRKSYLDTVN